MQQGQKDRTAQGGRKWSICRAFFFISVLFFYISHRVCKVRFGGWKKGRIMGGRFVGQGGLGKRLLPSVCGYDSQCVRNRWEDMIPTSWAVRVREMMIFSLLWREKNTNVRGELQGSPGCPVALVPTKISGWKCRCSIFFWHCGKYWILISCTLSTEWQTSDLEITGYTLLKPMPRKSRNSTMNAVTASVLLIHSSAVNISVCPNRKMVTKTAVRWTLPLGITYRLLSTQTISLLWSASNSWI